MRAGVALDKCTAYPSICPPHTSASSKQSQLDSEWNPNHMHVPHPKQSHLFLPIKKKKSSWAGFLSAPNQTGLTPHLHPREEWLQLQFVSLCAHAAHKTPNTPETAEVICTLNLDLGACGTIKCVPGQTSQPESLSACLLYSSLEIKGGVSGR